MQWFRDWYNDLNEHAPYKGGGGQAKMVLAKIVWHAQNVAVQTPDRTSKKEPKPRTLELFLAQNNCYTITKVARVSTCYSCFRRVIADIKSKYRLLLVDKTPQGIQTQLLVTRKKGPRFPSSAYSPGACEDERSYGKLIARKTAIWSHTNAAQRKNRFAKISPIIPTILYTCDIATMVPVR